MVSDINNEQIEEVTTQSKFKKILYITIVIILCLIIGVLVLNLLEVIDIANLFSKSSTGAVFCK